MKFEHFMKTCIILCGKTNGRVLSVKETEQVFTHIRVCGNLINCKMGHQHHHQHHRRSCRSNGVFKRLTKLRDGRPSIAHKCLEGEFKTSGSLEARSYSVFYAPLLLLRVLSLVEWGSRPICNSYSSYYGCFVGWE